MKICASCNLRGCYRGDLSKTPKDCPSLDGAEQDQIKSFYQEEDLEMAKNAALVEAKGYGEWTRLEEIMQFAKKMNYKKLGLAFCIGLSQEAKTLEEILRHHKFEVSSMICKNGGISKEFIDIKPEEQLRPGFEVMCNPIGQAEFLNLEETDFNIVLGLCVGHDSLFYKYSKAPVTVLAVKDRRLGHNPMVALYQAKAYLKKRFFGDKE